MTAMPSISPAAQASASPPAPAAPAAPTAAASPPSEAFARRRRLLARLAWLAVTLPALLLFASVTLVFYRQQQTVCLALPLSKREQGQMPPHPYDPKE